MAQQNYGSVREYIGARYVPVFANPAQWDNGREYEPLTIVMNEGNSYTSTQYVPTGIDISNETYWALTGNYNAQVEAYRKEVQTLDDRITTNTDDIAANMGEIADIKTEVADIKTEVATTNENVTKAQNDATSAKTITDKIDIASTIANHILFQTAADDTQQVSIVYFTKIGAEDRSNLMANKSGISFHVNGEQIWAFSKNLQKFGLTDPTITRAGLQRSISGSGNQGISVFEYYQDSQPNDHSSIHFTDRSILYYSGSELNWSFNPIKRITYPMNDLQIALQNNIAIISCNGITVNLTEPSEWQIIATPQQLGLSATSGESVYGAANVDYEDSSAAATLRFNPQGLAIRASGQTAGTHNVYGQVCAVVNVTWPAETIALGLDEMDDNIAIVPNDPRLMTFKIEEE